MVKTSPIHEKGDQPRVEQPDLSVLSNEQLVQLCLEHNRPAWDEFFRRFIPDIIQAIRKKLISRDCLGLSDNQDVLWDIHKKIVEKLYGRGKLSKCENPSGIRGWLKTMAHNQTSDWLTEQGRKKRLPQRQTENAMGSLSTPLSEDTDLTVGDTIAADSETDDELTTYV